MLHVFDCRLAEAPWLQALLEQRARFLLRQPGNYHLQVALGQEPPARKFATGRRLVAFTSLGIVLPALAARGRARDPGAPLGLSRLL